MPSRDALVRSKSANRMESVSPIREEVETGREIKPSASSTAILKRDPPHHTIISNRGTPDDLSTPVSQRTTPKKEGSAQIASKQLAKFYSS